MKPKILLFDLFGTLVDVGGVADECERVFPGHGEQLSRVWRDKQLKYTWLRTLMGRYENFERITQHALVAACNDLRLHPDDALKEDLPAAFERLKPFPEVPTALASLASDGFHLGVLSNGTRQQASAVLAQSAFGVPILIFSADDVRLYKPAPGVYAFGVQQVQAEVGEVLFVSANAWDVAGARAFGLSCAWLDRARGSFEELDVTPTIVAHDLDDLVHELRQREA
ncbi:MAG: haloacid dehalogenase type II [Thermaerobacter sp.]|nr:haloacid dehalogenase type II [Thermaerobacter sp.]